MNCTARHGYRQHQLLLQRELGQWASTLELPLTPVHQRIVQTLDWLDMDSLVGYAGKTVGRPERSRVALALTLPRSSSSAGVSSSARVGFGVIAASIDQCSNGIEFARALRDLRAGSGL